VTDLAGSWDDTEATKADYQQAKREARDRDTATADAYNAGRDDSSSSGGGGGIRTSIPIPAASRKVVGLMAGAVIFTVLSEEIKMHQKGATTGPPTAGHLSSPAKTILGGTIATALLSFMTEAGPTGQQLGVGLAAVTAVTAVLVNGGPVFTVLRNLFGAQVTTGSTSSTGTTNATVGQAATGPTAPTTAATH
jgi:hypothetical protein